MANSRSDLVAMGAVGGGLLGALLLGGRPVMLCGIDPDCIFSSLNLIIKGGAYGIGIGFIGGAILAVLMRKPEKKRKRELPY